MKKIIYLSFLALLLASCDKSLLTDPKGLLSADKNDEIALKDPDKAFRSIIDGINSNIQRYDTASDHNQFGQKSFDYLFSLYGNDLCMPAPYSMSRFDYEIDYRGETFKRTAHFWGFYYSVIRDANSILKNIPDGTTDPTTLSYKAQALTYRGYAYFYLVNLYQFAYSEDTKNLPGVPDITEKSEGPQARATLQQNYDRITSDLTQARELFNQVGKNVTTSKTDVDGVVAAVYLARAYMFIHKYDKALEEAEFVIANSTIITSDEELYKGFSELNLTSTLFGFKMTPTATTVYSSYFSQMDSYGSGYAAIGIDRFAFAPLMERLPETDKRKHWWVDDKDTLTLTGAKPDKNGKYPLVYLLPRQATYSGKPGDDKDPRMFYSTKYVNSKFRGKAAWLSDYIYLRAEEAHFIKAEALAQLDRLGDAATFFVNFNKVRDDQYTAMKASDKDAIIEEIIFYKRIEFWCEGLEYLDNRRLNYPIDRAVVGTNHYDTAKFRIEQSDKRLIYQIPISEIESNPNINRADQNI